LNGLFSAAEYASKENKDTRYSPMKEIIACTNRLRFHGLPSLVPFAGDVPPRVLPTELKVGFAGPAFRTAFSIALVSFLASAPLIVSITVELRRIRKVGIAVTPYLREISCCESTLTLVKVTTLGFENLTERLSYVGAIALHGPHQSA